MVRKPRWANCWGPPETTERLRTTETYWKQPFKWQREAEARGEPALVFCASLADVFEQHPHIATWRIEMFEDLVLNTPWLRWLVLTKRPWRAAEFFENRPELLSGNVWLGTSIEDQWTVETRISDLFRIQPPVRFVSIEPMLNHVNLKDWGVPPIEWTIDQRRLLHWVIIGCESGPNRRPMELAWAQDVVDQCKEAGIPVFVKQLPINGRVSHDPAEWPEDLRIREFPT